MNITARRKWGGASFAAGDLSTALGCTRDAVDELVSLIAPPPCLNGTWKVELAIASALHLQAGIELSVAAAIVRSRRKLCEAVLSTLDFFPPILGADQGLECDPFMFFAPHAAAAAAVPAIDHYIDVLDGRRINWRRPRNDAYRLACELHRLSNAVKSDGDCPAPFLLRPIKAEENPHGPFSFR